MSILTPDRTYAINIGGFTRNVHEKIIPATARATKHVADWVKQGQPMKPNAKLSDGTGKPRGITTHNTPDIIVSASTTPAEQYVRATWPNCNMGGVVVHFFVWRDVIWQTLAEDERGWHASDGTSRRDSRRTGQKIGGNLDTIAIECIGADRETEESAAILTAYLLKKHGLEPIDVYTHNFFMGQPDRIVSGAGKNCPLYILPRWTEYIARIMQLYSAGVSSPAVPQTPAITQSIAIDDTVIFSGGNVYASSTATVAAGQKGRSTCKVTAMALGKARPYHLVSQDGGGVFAWVDAANVTLPEIPAEVHVCNDVAALRKELAQWMLDYAELEGQLKSLSDNYLALSESHRIVIGDIEMLAKAWVK